MKPASKELRRSCALVTGASSGIGAATAEALAEAGMDLILVARREERLKFMQNDLSNRFSVRVNVRALDIRSADAVAEFAKTADLRAVDVLVNNAGLAKGTDPMQSGNIGEWEQMIDTNIKGLLYLTRNVLPGMSESGRGHIVNLGSVAGRGVYPG
ncbi:MAG: SDR family NAD(P)-dependent oxidoreductase, partial [Bdellovibrionales bacterium]